MPSSDGDSGYECGYDGCGFIGSSRDDVAAHERSGCTRRAAYVHALPLRQSGAYCRMPPFNDADFLPADFQFQPESA